MNITKPFVLENVAQTILVETTRRLSFAPLIARVKDIRCQSRIEDPKYRHECEDFALRSKDILVVVEDRSMLHGRMADVIERMKNATDIGRLIPRSDIEFQMEVLVNNESPMAEVLSVSGWVNLETLQENNIQ